MYTLQEVYGNVAANGDQITMVFGLLVLSAYFQVCFAIYLGFRDKSHAIPLVPLMLFFAHDTEHFFNYDYWHHTISNPFFQGGYWTFPLYIVAELVMFYQIIRYSRAEVFPGATLSQSIGLLVLLQLATFIGYLWLHEQMGDPLYLGVALGVTQFASHAFNIPMLMHRKNRKGQSLWFAANIILGAGIINWFFGLPLFAEQYRTPLHYGMGLVTIGLGVAYFFLLWKAPKYVPETKQGDAISGQGRNASLA